MRTRRSGTSEVTPVVVTDLYPTRYEAFDKPGTIFVFAYAADGSFWHARRDGKRVTTWKLAIVTEQAVYNGPEGFFEVRPARDRGFTWETTVGHFRKGSGREPTLHEAIASACASLGIPPPERDVSCTEVSRPSPAEATV